MLGIFKFGTCDLCKRCSISILYALKKHFIRTHTHIQSISNWANKLFIYFQSFSLNFFVEYIRVYIRPKRKLCVCVCVRSLLTSIYFNVRKIAVGSAKENVFIGTDGTGTATKTYVYENG